MHHTVPPLAPRTPKHLWDAAFDALDAEKPDLILLLGDFIDYSPDAIDDLIVNVLSKLRANDGVYGVLGNHDEKHGLETKQLLLRKMYSTHAPQ